MDKSVLRHSGGLCTLPTLKFNTFQFSLRHFLDPKKNFFSSFKISQHSDTGIFHFSRNFSEFFLKFSSLQFAHMAQRDPAQVRTTGAFRSKFKNKLNVNGERSATHEHESDDTKRGEGIGSFRSSLCCIVLLCSGRTLSVSLFSVLLSSLQLKEKSRDVGTHSAI